MQEHQLKVMHPAPAVNRRRVVYNSCPAGTSHRLSRIERRDILEAEILRARPVSEGGAYARLRTAEALEESRRVREDVPLAGFTLAVKDLIAVAGWSIGAGSRLRAGTEPEAQDAPVVAALRRAGAILVGATALHELALGVTGVNGHSGTPVNPDAPGCVPGGSSSGSAAAVADGSARVALGTDTGGSGRIPAALCGVVGFKPEYGSYPTRGVLALAPSFDHVGIMARRVDDVIRVHAVLAHAVPAAGRAPAIGVLRSAVEDAAPEVAGPIEEALDRLAAAGCRVRDVSVADGAADDVPWASTTVIFAEAAATHAAERARWETHVQVDVLARLIAGSQIHEHDHREALRRGAALRARVGDVLGDADVLLTPTVPILPPPLAAATDPALPARLVANTRLANLTGIPAISLPLGDGVGLQLMGRTNERLLADAAWIEKALGTGTHPAEVTRTRASRSRPGAARAARGWLPARSSSRRDR